MLRATYGLLVNLFIAHILVDVVIRWIFHISQRRQLSRIVKNKVALNSRREFISSIHSCEFAVISSVYHFIARTIFVP